jgi:hypothetical protein
LTDATKVRWLPPPPPGKALLMCFYFVKGVPNGQVIGGPSYSPFGYQHLPNGEMLLVDPMVKDFDYAKTTRSARANAKAAVRRPPLFTGSTTLSGAARVLNASIASKRHFLFRPPNESGTFQITNAVAFGD